MRINSISPVMVNNANLRTRKNIAAKSTETQPAIEPAKSGNVAFKGTFGAIAGGVVGAFMGSVLTLVTMGAASAAVLPIIAIGAAIGHSEEEKSKKEEKNKKK